MQLSKGLHNQVVKIVVPYPTALLPNIGKVFACHTGRITEKKILSRTLKLRYIGYKSRKCTQADQGLIPSEGFQAYYVHCTITQFL